MINLIVAAVLFFLSALGCTISPSFTILVSVRIVGGIGVGIASVTSPLYISEFSPPKIRGRLVALYQLSIVTGINAVIYYGPEILGQAGIQFGNALQFQVILGIINLVFTVLALLLIDKLGRRPLLIGGMGLVVLTLLIAGLFISLVCGILWHAYRLFYFWSHLSVSHPVFLEVCP